MWRGILRCCSCTRSRRSPPTRGAGTSMPRRFRMRPAVCSTAGPARRPSAACSTTGPAFPRSTIPTARTCSSRSKACRRRTMRAKYQKPDHDLDTIGDLFAALRSCWSPPPDDSARRACRCRCASASSESGEHHRSAARDLCHRGRRRPIPATTYLNAINASLECLPAAEIHRRPRRRASPGGRSRSAMSIIASLEAIAQRRILRTPCASSEDWPRCCSASRACSPHHEAVRAATSAQ